MTDSSDELHYPHLVSCRVTIMGEGRSSTRTPVTLPPECVRVANASPRVSSYDYSLERNVLKRLADREDDQIIVKARNRAELQMATLRKMKSVTGARDDICTTLLESNKYDLKASIEAYYLR